MHEALKFFIFVAGLSFTFLTNAQEKRNLLTDFFTRSFVGESICKDNCWIKYPSYNEREAWTQLPENLRQETIKEGEKYLGYNWPPITATMYLEFTRTGDRAIVDRAISNRRVVLRSLVLAELMEGKGRFIDDIINGVFVYCEQTYWGMSATFYMYKTGFKGFDNPNTVLPDINDPIVDLSVGDAAADLAWTWYFFNKEFDKISPVISKRLKNELQKKVLDPFYERYDFWWITGWGEGNVNNWTPWCNYNILTCIALIEDDPVKKEVGIYKTMASVDLFINSYPNDGGCDEGPNYWSVAGGKLFDYLDLLHQITNGNIDIFSNDLIKNMGRYIYRVYIANSPKGQFYVNYSDSPAIIRHDGGRIYRYGKQIQDHQMLSFGAFLLKESNFIGGRIGEALENLFNIKGWQDTQIIEPLISHFYFSDREIVIARENEGTTSGFYFAAKGGNNAESHNHNDVGTCILFFNGKPVLVDVGVGTYTAKTFSDQRYKIWTMQSEYHNLPVINGFGQTPGRKFEAKNSNYELKGNKSFFSTDIAGAYSQEAKVNKWIRSYTLDISNRYFRISDNYQLEDNFNGIDFHFISPLNIQILGPGIMELKDNEFTLYLKYNPLILKVQLESIDIDDNNLQRVWGNNISRIVFKMKNKDLNGNIIFDIIKALQE
ncbi:Hypothetical protein PSM36_2210 [Proteiniphilum saccharofermentans]|uniref:Heparinase II/III-like C-terminal domain-containing protein n=1 Tax=Proteiniphilum saccharofermentans TaxID=1642647 RepID=A0A1R3TAN0_9BACT|nr:heparinase II/III family protein [Proteiniphilum saccharofermentans]SCD21015.1 Hypothetical protein PSM36_2210 [Proteiniphilum saccharofermentans]